MANYDPWTLIALVVRANLITVPVLVLCWGALHVVYLLRREVFRS